jgi:hypothetical protein
MPDYRKEKQQVASAWRNRTWCGGALTRASAQRRVAASAAHAVQPVPQATAVTAAAAITTAAAIAAVTADAAVAAAIAVGTAAAVAAIAAAIVAIDKVSAGGECDGGRQAVVGVQQHEGLTHQRLAGTRERHLQGGRVHASRDVSG